MSAAISRQNAERYAWGEGCEGWWLVRSAGVAVIEERMPPGTSERRHVHVRARQFFYVLAGELTLVMEGVETLVGVFQGVEVGPGVVHQVFNRGAGEARFLVVSQPPSRGDREEMWG